MTQLICDEEPGHSTDGAGDGQDLLSELPLEMEILSSLGPDSIGAGDCQVIIANPSLKAICDRCGRPVLDEDSTYFSCDVEACDMWYHRVCLDGGEQAMADLSVMIGGD